MAMGWRRVWRFTSIQEVWRRCVAAVSDRGTAIHQICINAGWHLHAHGSFNTTAARHKPLHGSTHATVISSAYANTAPAVPAAA